MKTITALSFVFIFSISLVLAQKDQAIYKQKKDGFYQDSIQSGILDFEKTQTKKEDGNYLSVDFSAYSFPTKIADYTEQWHNNPLSQGATGTCWCFSGISFLESEIYRTSEIKIKLSEMYVVYWEYVARAAYFVDKRGDMNLGEGSELNAVTKIIKEHGIVPASVYSGKLAGQKYHNHEKLFEEIKSYLMTVKTSHAWNKTTVIETVKSILNHYLGTPPESFKYLGKEYSPLDFSHEYLKINSNDYVCFMSTKSKTYNQKGELVEPDNWWHSDNYYNLPLNDFISVIKNALKNGYTVGICFDVSEPGYDRYEEVGIIPTFDIPAEFIDENSREFRMNNNTTTDDHCVHILGYNESDGESWFLIKDSSSSAFDGPNKGYRFIREDYAKLKVLAVMVHKYGAKNVLDKIIK